MTGLATTLPTQTWSWIYTKTSTIIDLPTAAALAATILFMNTIPAEIILPALLLGLFFPIGIETTGLCGTQRDQLALAHPA